MKILIALLLIVAVQEPDPRAEFERLLPSNLNLGHVPSLIFSDDEEAFLRGVRILHDLRYGPGDPERMVELHLIPFRRAREKQWKRGREASEWFILTYLRSPWPKAADPLAQLRGMLEDSKDPADRRTLALFTLAEGKAERPQLLEFVKDARAEVRSIALHRLADLNDPADTGLIASFLADEDSMIQHSAIQMLTRRSAIEHIDAIAKFMDDRWYFNRRGAIDAIGRMRVHRLAQRVVPFLADPTEGGADARTHALEALKALDPGAAIGDVAAFCSHADARVRRSAVALIGHWKSKRHTRVIASMLRDPHDKVREEAVDALAAMGASNLTGRLAERLDDDSEMVRSRAAIALGNLGAKRHAGTIAGLGREGRIAKGAVAHALILLDGADRTETVVDLLDGMAREFKPAGHLISARPARIPSLEDLVALAGRNGLNDCIVGLLKRVKGHAREAETMILQTLSDAGTARLWKKLGDLGLLVSREAQTQALRGLERTLTPETVPALIELVRKLGPPDGIEPGGWRKLSGFADAVAPYTEDESPAIRQLAGKLLCDSRQTKHLRRLIRLMEDQDKDVRAYITQTAARMPSTDHHEAIGRRLYDPEPSVRREAAIAISSLRLNRFTPAVVGLLEDPDPEVVDGVLYALEFLDYRKEAARIVPLLENPKWAAQAAGLLGKWGGAESIEPLLTLANEGTPEARGAAIRALALLGANDRLSNLDALLAHKEEHVRSAAAYAVGILRDAARKPTLVNLLKDPRHLVKANAAAALAELGARDQVSGILALLELPEEQNVERVSGGWQLGRHAAEEAAAAALVKLAAVEAAPTIARLLKKSNEPFAGQRLGSALIRLDAKRYVPEILSVHVPNWPDGPLYQLNRAGAPRLYDRIAAAALLEPRVLERGPLMHRARRFSQAFGVRIVIDPSVPDEVRRRDEILMITGDTAHQVFANLIPPECAAIFDDDASEIRIVPLEAARKFWLEWAGTK